MNELYEQACQSDNLFVPNKIHYISMLFQNRFSKKHECSKIRTFHDQFDDKITGFIGRN